MTTPISATRAHYWWVEGQNYGDGTEAQRFELRQMLEVTFQQDKDILEAIQNIIRHDKRHANAREVSFMADRPGLHARKILNDMLAAD